MASTSPPAYQALASDEPEQTKEQQEPPPTTTATPQTAQIPGAVNPPPATHQVPVQQVPVQQVPLQQVPLQQVPLQQVPLQQVPVQQVPVQQVPQQQVPIQQVPIQQVPIQQWGGQVQAWPPQGPVYNYPTPGVAQPAPVQYVVAPQLGGPGYQYPPTAVIQPTTIGGPHDFLILSLVITIICGILNLLSLSFGIPAIILSVLSLNSKGNKNYPRAKTYGKYALFVTVCNIFFTLLFALLITGLVVVKLTRPAQADS